MEDLSEKLNRLLADPDGMAKIRSAMAALGADAPSESPKESVAVPGGPDPALLTRLLPLLSGGVQEDEDTRLLAALKPYLHGQRAQRLEESMRLLQMAKLLPLLQQQGILSGIGGGGHSG